MNIQKESVDKGSYHFRDIECLQKDNEWMKAFYRHSMDDVEKTLLLMDEVLLWRKATETHSKIFYSCLSKKHKIMKRYIT